MLIEKLNIISGIFKSHYGIILCEANKFTAKGNYSLLKEECETNGIVVEEIGSTIFIDIKSFIKIYTICFSEIRTYFESTNINQDFAIIDSDGDYCYNNILLPSLVINESAKSEFKYSCTNLFFYYKFYNFLKSEEFADHHNDANLEIIIYSSAKGIFKIKYVVIPIIEKSKDISKSVTELIESATPVQLRPFFKNALFTFSNDTGIISIDEIIHKSTDIIASSKRDYEIVSKQFDFTKFRDSLYTEKEKYFSNIREIVNKIFSQAIGIPISISATVFATYKVTDDSIMLALVWLSFIIYVIFYIKIQLVYKADLQDLKIVFTSDFEIIKSKSGLPLNLILAEKGKVEKKITNSITIINLLIGVISILGLLVSCYIFYELGKSDTTCINIT